MPEARSASNQDASKFTTSAALLRAPAMSGDGAGGSPANRSVHPVQALRFTALLQARILLVDDDKLILGLLSEMLEVMGCEVVTATNGIEALREFSTRSFDMVLTDLKMPCMDGRVLAGRIKASAGPIPVAMMTGQSSHEVADMIRCGLIDAVIYKPFQLHEIRRLMTCLLPSQSRPA